MNIKEKVMDPYDSDGQPLAIYFKIVSLAKFAKMIDHITITSDHNLQSRLKSQGLLNLNLFFAKMLNLNQSPPSALLIMIRL